MTRLECASRTIGLVLTAWLLSAKHAQAADWETWRPYLDRGKLIWSHVEDFVMASYGRVPGLVLGLAALLLIPPLAIFGLFLLRLGKHRDRAMSSSLPKTPFADNASSTGAAFIEILPREGHSSATRLPLPRTMVSLGRHEDNAIRIPDKTVHRYHAVIHWTPETDFVITDLSGESGNGVLINGSRVAQAALANGDVIELGAVKLKFAMEPT